MSSSNVSVKCDEVFNMNIINIVLKNAKNAVTYFKNNEYKDLESIVLRYVKRLNVKIRFKFSNEKKKKNIHLIIVAVPFALIFLQYRKKLQINAVGF